MRAVTSHGVGMTLFTFTPLQSAKLRYYSGVFYFCLAGYHDEILQKPDRLLPTYLPYLWETKKEITGWVKVGYYTN